MELKTARTCIDLAPVLFTPIDKLNNIDETVYWVYSGVTQSKWENMTIISPQKLGSEFPKTFGHYHTQNVLETYKLIHGKGLLLLQKKYYENDMWVPNKLDRVYLVKLEPNEEIIITPEWGHSWSNIGDEPLVTLDDWRAGHTHHDYDPVERQKGMGFYLTHNGDEVKIEPNHNYKALPVPKIISLKGFYQITGRL
jgi:oxalate decarboxylase/phosphoglucose isomerase-like protein (cupin superfamily)